MHKLRFRQIHLDFHTSEHIPGIGTAFDKAAWQKRLKDAHVNSITIFATCHHGWSYFDTDTGYKHPELEGDLLRQQFDACKEIDVNAPIYITAGVANKLAYEHPEWREVSHDGTYTGWAQARTDAGFHKLCFNTPYLDWLCTHIEEVVQKFPNNDGIFLDIISQNQCCCRWCMDDMEEQGLNADCEEDRKTHAKNVLMKYYERTTDAVKKHYPGMAIFHNSGHIARGRREILPFFSHMELESLPTGGWGYDHFPMSVKYCNKLEHDTMGMTGKFHTTWGEFGGFKHPNALKYECAAMIAFGAKCSVGDQLHPNGALDEGTYDLIGEAYADVEAKEAWCDNVDHLAEIAILSIEATNRQDRGNDAPDVGAARMLLEGHFLFDLIDTDMAFDQYKALILPDESEVNDTLRQKLNEYVAQGGKLIISGNAARDAAGNAIFDIGGESNGLSEFSPDFMLPREDLRPDYIKTPFVNYGKSTRFKAVRGESIGDIYDPYFNRSYKHFCSHQHTPFKPDPSGYHLGAINGNTLYFAMPVFSIYRGMGSVALKDFVLKTMRHFLGASQIKTNLPSTARINVTEQADAKRYITHLLYANTIARGGNMNLSGGTLSREGLSIEVIEDLLPLHDTTVELTLDKPITKATLEPQGQDLTFTQDGNTVTFTVDKFSCHQMVALQYA